MNYRKVESKVNNKKMTLDGQKKKGILYITTQKKMHMGGYYAILDSFNWRKL